MPPRHAQEKETVKPKRPAKLIAAAEKNLTIIRENVPVMALTGVAFGASYGHIAKLCGDYGPHGWVQYATAGCVDLLCIIGAEERQRDKRIGRDRSWGFLSWPTLVLIVGILVTLAANVATADRDPFGYCVSAWPAGALLLAVSILERRTSHATVPVSPASTAPGRRQSRASTAGEPVAVPAVPASPVPERSAATAASTGGAVSAEPVRERTFGELVAEARAYRDELTAAGTGERPTKERLRLRLGVSSARALEVCRALKDDGPDEAREASGAVG
jgi:hypothetical protein